MDAQLIENLCFPLSLKHQKQRRDRTAESRKPNGMGAADERLQGTGRGSCESGIDL